jgi:hypothetical protein
MQCKSKKNSGLSDQKMKFFAMLFYQNESWSHPPEFRLHLQHLVLKAIPRIQEICSDRTKAR